MMVARCPVFLREPRATTRPCFTVHPPSATVATPAPPLGRHRVAPAIHLSSSIFPFLSPVPIPYFPGSPSSPISSASSVSSLSLLPTLTAMADDEPVDQKRYLEGSCKPKCVKPLLEYQKQTRDATILSFCSSIAFFFLPSVQRVAMAISPSGINPAVGSKLSPGSPESLTLANWICCSYRQVCICLSNDALHFCVLFSSNNSYYLGAELLKFDSLIGESVLKYLWHHQDAILCCSLKSVPVFIFANQAGLDKLETTLVALQDITWVFRGR
ncbi:hypothetical protein Ahy_A06g029338 [Arachis hypogaea]|uniref:MEKHLA domain-containing protein n=1 Tax=Arachis hypogaea TaxID=3818 RepID=A0A445CT58_ARAHY|nr:hypothetical protein Ahy_A06g029336 [Arachis hypogaea]RYR54074.1 hypothetical protein Ahy_A06g029337 [Arachis hypogaea]RYR54075.1 hypothetical protein Ahy_A06g029338 [Arachis hypogaea]